MLRHASASIFRRTGVSQNWRSLARQRRGGRPPSELATVPPPPRPADDPWQEVKDEKSGQIYYWNTHTNETTALGAPKPTSGGAVAQAQPQQQGGGFMSTMAEGFAFGAGASIARQAVGSLFGGFGGGGGYGSDDGGGAAPMDQQSDESNYEWGNDSWGDDSGSDGDGWT